MDQRTYDKIKACQEPRNECPAPAPTQPYYGDACTQAPIGGGCESGRPMREGERVINSLSERAFRASVEGERAKRSLEILTAHPEFLEFLELMRLGMV